jgi:homoaconitate hydratase
MGQTVVEKIAQAHMTTGPLRPVRAGDFLALAPKHVLTHDNTAPVIRKFEGIGAERIHDPRQPVFALDHDIQNRSDSNLAKYDSIRAFAEEHGVDFYPAGTGIGHQVMCEQLYVTPGALVVASDSHANMYGGLGALGTPVVRTDAAAIWATGEFWWQVPPSVRVELTGELRVGATGKDVIIALCGLYNQGEVLNAAVEVGGPGLVSLSVEERLCIANMTTEWGALAGWFPVDTATLAFLRARREALGETARARVSDQQLAAWETDPPAPDADAPYAARITLDLSSVTPHVAGPDSVQVMAPLAELESKAIEVNKAYLVSCVNARYGDLAAAAEVLDGKTVASGVELYVAAASQAVQAEAEKSGIWQTLVAAGARTLPPGCGPCIGLGAGLLEPGEVGISATNRNFKGRMGSRDAQCYLASPAVVAASAAAGVIRGPEKSAIRPLETKIEVAEAAAQPQETVEILDGFPAAVTGRLVFLPQDNLNTDGIYGKDYTYRDDMTPEMMAEVVMQNYDPAFAVMTEVGDILVGAYNFGTGSSREQAVTALQAKGIALVVAASFSQTYLRNAFNNGFACIACPALVEHLRARFGSGAGKTVVPGDTIRVDFASGTIEVGSETFRFPPLGEVPQALVAAGGIENQVRQKLGL